jgi:hypothetical protein
VAACRQTIANSDAALDLHDRGVALGSAISTPLVDGDRVVGVFTAYAAANRTFTDDQSRLVEMMAPHWDASSAPPCARATDARPAGAAHRNAGNAGPPRRLQPVGNPKFQIPKPKSKPNLIPTQSSHSCIGIGIDWDSGLGLGFAISR